jgi:hypothetical protein
MASLEADSQRRAREAEQQGSVERARAGSHGVPPKKKKNKSQCKVVA